MKQLVTKLGAGLLGLALCGSVHGQECCIDWSVGARALLWQQGDCTFRFAEREVVRDNEALIVRDFIGVGPDWDWGVDVFARADFNCRWYAQVDYLWYENSSSKRVDRQAGDQQLLVSGDLNVDGGRLNDWDFIRGHQNTRLQHVDLKVGRDFHRGCCGRFDGFALVRCLDLKAGTTVRGVAFDAQEEPNLYTNFTKTGYKAGGLGVGVAGECNLGCGLGVFGEGALVGYLGKQQRSTGRGINAAQLEQEIPIAESSFVNPKEANWIPGFEAKIGVNYTYACGCWDFVAQLAWEARNYYHAIYAISDFPFFADYARRRNASFGGPTFGLQVGY